MFGLEAILGKIGVYVVGAVAVLLAILGFGAHKKRQGKLEERAATQAEGSKRSVEAHERAREIEREAGKRPPDEYPGGVRRPGGDAGKP